MNYLIIDISKFLNYQPNPFYQPNPVHNNNNNLGNIINSVNNQNNYNNINNNYNSINNNNIINNNYNNNNNNNFNNINNNNFNNFNNNININNNQPILSIQKGISNYNLLLEVKEICFQSIISNNWTNYIQISNIIKNNLIQVFNCNWWILVGDNISFSYNNIDPNLVMIFHFSYLNFNFYIHVSQI